LRLKGNLSVNALCTLACMWCELQACTASYSEGIEERLESWVRIHFWDYWR